MPFYGNQAKVMDMYKFELKYIYIIDKTGATTVQEPKVVFEKETKQVGVLTSWESGILVTVTLAVNAIGNNVPPIFIFPRLRHKDRFFCVGPVRCIRTGMRSDGGNYFQKHTNASIENKVLLLLDNHQSHIGVRCSDFCL